MLVGQLILGTVLGLGSGIYAYLALDVSIWLAFAIYSGVGGGAILFAAVSIVLFARRELPEAGPTGSIPEFAG